MQSGDRTPSYKYIYHGPTCQKYHVSNAAFDGSLSQIRRFAYLFYSYLAEAMDKLKRGTEERNKFGLQSLGQIFSFFWCIFAPWLQVSFGAILTFNSSR